MKLVVRKTPRYVHNSLIGGASGFTVDEVDEVSFLR